MSLANVQYIEEAVQDVGKLISLRVCKSVNSQVTIEIGGQKHRVVPETCQDIEEVEVSTKDF